MVSADFLFGGNADMDCTENNKQFENSDIPFAFGGRIIEIDQANNVYLMNNHRLAYSCWKANFDPSSFGRVLMLHVDAHPDAISRDFTKDIFPIGERDAEQLKIFSDRYLKYDNFLYPYFWEFREKIYLLNLCHESEVCNGFEKDEFDDVGGADFEYTTNQDDFFKLLADLDYDGLILDLDLDYFTERGDIDAGTSIWCERQVDNFMKSLEQALKKKPDIATIATSPFCLGSTNGNDQELLRRADFLYKIVRKYI
jgi:hypothetical protein